MLAQSEVREIVQEEIRSLLVDWEDGLGAMVPDEAQLHELGMNSLTLARLFIQLEAALGVDPFSTGAVPADVRSVGDLIALCEHVVRTSREANAAQPESCRAA